MVLKKDNRVGNWTVPKGFETDECTLVPEFDIGDWCILHDFLRRYGVVPVGTADRIFREGIRDSGRPVLAWVYWWGVKIMRPWFSKTQLLPHKWAVYGYETRGAKK
jgi:hypothetical protein